MAAGRIARPGTEYGPCEGDCRHPDCASSRAMAGAVCKYCEKPIGYDTRFYIDGDVPHDMAIKEYRYVHALCLEEFIDAHRYVPAP